MNGVNISEKTINSDDINKIRNIQIIKKNIETITTNDELELLILGNNGKPKPEYKKLGAFFKNLKNHLEEKFKEKIDPVKYLYYLYNVKKLTARDIYEDYAYMGSYSSKAKESIKIIMVKILKWELDGKIEKSTVGYREKHIGSSTIHKTKHQVRNILVEDYKYLSERGIKSPIRVTTDELNNLSKKDKETLMRYKHLILNKLFLERNKISSTKAKIAMESSVPNGKKDFHKEFPIEGIKKDIITYPLNQIFIYITENIEKLKGNNINQIKVAKKFKISNLGIFYRIFSGLGLLEKTGWKLINLPVIKFEGLVKEINKLEVINGENLFNIGLKLGIKNPAHLYTGISALGLAEKYKLAKINLSNSQNVLKIKNSIDEKILDNRRTLKNNIITFEDINDIINLNLNLLPKEHNEQVKIIRSIFIFLGYKVENIY